MEQTKDPGDKSLEHSPKDGQKTVPETSSPIIETEDMNNKPHTENTKTQHTNSLLEPRKKVKTYLFEFLMLFLAVFCGFVADNFREKLSEHQREKIFIRSIVEDIKSDTLESNKIIVRLKSMKVGIDSVLSELSSSHVVANSNNLYRLWSRNMGLEVFVSNDRTIQQLKSSGELRLIRNIPVSDRIMKYDQTLKRYYTQSNLMYSAMSNMTYYSHIFDFIKLNKNHNVPIPLTEEGKKSLNQAYGNLDLWNRGLGGLISWLENVNEEGKSMVLFIKKEYHLD
jgi:hypothetical protein